MSQHPPRRRVIHGWQVDFGLFAVALECGHTVHTYGRSVDGVKYAPETALCHRCGAETSRRAARAARAKIRRDQKGAVTK